MSIESAPMKDSELGQYVCVAHGGCLHSPHITIRSDGVWVKQAPGGPFSSAHRDCFEAWQLREEGAGGTMTVEGLATLILTQTRQVLKAKGYQSQIDAEGIEVTPGPKYTKIDRGPEGNRSGMLMIDNATGEIFGIQGYGKVHKGRRYGTLETVGQWFWGEYRPRKYEEKKTS